MTDAVGYFMVSLMIVLLVFSSVRQVRYTWAYQRTEKTAFPGYRRALFGHYLLSLSLIGFMISFILNVLTALQLIHSNLITSDNTAFSCFIFLAVLLLANFRVIPKTPKAARLLNNR